MSGKKDNVESQSVAIIGGGVIGMSTAFHLAEKDVSKITVIDKGYIGGGSSLQAAGIVTSLEWNETAIRARVKTLDNFERFSQILDGYSFHQVGCLNLLSEEDYIGDKDLRDLQIKLGSKVEILQGGKLSDKFKDVVAAPNEYGVLDLRGGYSEPHRYVPALKNKIEKMGVDIREHEEVVGFDLQGAQIKGIVTRSSVNQKETKEKFDIVICAVNAWINHLLSWVDFQIPMKNFIHERFVTKPFETKLNLPAINDRVVEGYIRPTEDNRLLVGTDAYNPENFIMPNQQFTVDQLTPDPRALPFLRERFRSRVPVIESAVWDYHTVGLISITRDATPVIGPMPGIDGLFVGSNFHSGGFAYNPVAGQLIAEHVVDGETSIDSERYLPQRFIGFDTKSYLQNSMTIDDMKFKRH
tara:strand:- start:928 stop:2163 length:1236 start_codon:yes stop_codon:yes gene_type:complete